MKRVILTGASGFIGRQAIKPLLEKGYEIHAVSRNAPNEELLFENVNWHSVDLLNENETKKFLQKIQATHLLHFAWYVEHGKFWNAPENKIWLDASLKLIEHFQKAGGERIVISGTCAEYEWGKDSILSETKTPLNPASLYGKCKLELQEKLAETPLNWASGRVFFLYGEYEPPRRLAASVIKSVLKNEFADCSHGNQIRDFLYVKDVADAFVALIDSEKTKGAVNIGSGEATTIKQLVLQIADQLNKRENIRFGIIPAPADEPDSIVADVKRLYEEVGWRPKFNLSSGIRETINYWKNENND